MTQTTRDTQLMKLTANTLRLLAADGVQKANSGHPGMPMGMADVAAVLWSRYLRFNPQKPDWPNRDRFVLSAGHGSMLLYSLLHLSGYDVGLEDLKTFRQWSSRTPGHPELNCLPGVETTTGPLGQGFVNGVGMAIAARMAAARFNTDTHGLFGTHHIYAIVSDGDLMEGIASEAASLAGHLRLGNLIYFYDDNEITIAGQTRLTFSEDVQSRFNAYGWHTVTVDGHNHQAIAEAIEQGIDEHDRPTLIISKTHIGHGSPSKHDTAGVHGAPLGEDELKATKRNLGFSDEDTFYVPEEVKSFLDKRRTQLKKLYHTWEENFKDWQSQNPKLEQLRRQMQERQLPDDLETRFLDDLSKDANATRSISGAIMQKIVDMVPGLVGGSADLEPSTKTLLKKYSSIKAESFIGHNIHYGIREHAMGGITNGIALYGGFIPFGSTFLVFADYMRPSIRLAALMGIQSIFIFTHDSIFVGEDGPTHQPVEQLFSLRAIPNLMTLRPADHIETGVCWAMALRNRQGPTALLLTRQKVPYLPRAESFDPQTIKYGGYVISGEKSGAAKAAIIASGSEVQFALEAQGILQEKGYSVRVISMPCKEVFDKQPEAYRRTVLPAHLNSITIVEAGSPIGWNDYFNIPTLKLTLSRFGASAPYKVLEAKFGFNGQTIADNMEQFINSL
ncbi:MAG: transketolase [Caldithrix sp.]|nr:transketolase [Caldithrix sp.]